MAEALMAMKMSARSASSAVWRAASQQPGSRAVSKGAARWGCDHPKRGRDPNPSLTCFHLPLPLPPLLTS